MSATPALPTLPALPHPKRVVLFGATGSVGASTLDILRADPERFRLVGVAANADADGLAALAREFRPDMTVLADPARAARLEEALAGSGLATAAGAEAITALATLDADIVMMAVSGFAALAPTLAAARAGRTIALANKECLVAAGALVLDAVKRHGATLLPVDSEHNAIFQAFEPEHVDAVAKIILTASGGPFRTLPLAEMERATPAAALKHPNWSMGAKITIDSATMMNKGLEIIEAFHLFPVGAERIEVLVHPQSIIHSMVAYRDGSVIAQLGNPDMRTPIAYALNYPARGPSPVTALDLAAIGTLTFEAPDPVRFPALRLAKEALAQGGSAPATLNAANEIAVPAFLAGEIGFLDIARIVEEVLQTAPLAAQLTSLEAVIAADADARRRAQTVIRERRAA